MLKRLLFYYFIIKNVCVFFLQLLPWLHMAGKNYDVALRTSFTINMCRWIKKVFLYALKPGFLPNISVLLSFMFLLNKVSSNKNHHKIVEFILKSGSI